MTTLAKQTTPPKSDTKELPKIDKSTETPRAFTFEGSVSVPASAKEAVTRFSPRLPKLLWSLDTNLLWSLDTKPSLLKTIPLSTDNPFMTELKLNDLRGIIERGESLARATGWLAADDQDDLGYRWARSNLTPLESSRFLYWKESRNGPEVQWIDVQNNIDPKRESKDWMSLVAALQMIYPKQYITREKAYWFTIEHAQEMPLVHALVKIQKEGLMFVSEEALWTYPEKAEAQTAKRIVAAATASLKASQKVSEETERSIRRSIRFINSREWALESKVIEVDNRLRKDIVKKESA